MYEELICQLKACMDENIPCEEANCGYKPFSKDEDCIDNLMHRAVNAIEELNKRADAAEVRHGRWEWDRKREAYRCSSCQTHNTDRTAFCPNCGAKMDGEQEPPKEEA